jgi:hypothetical protein
VLLLLDGEKIRPFPAHDVAHPPHFYSAVYISPVTVGFGQIRAQFDGLKEWAGHASIETTDVFDRKVGAADYEAAANEGLGCAQLGTDKEKNTENTGAGEGIRTLDVQLGKLTLYH